MKRNGTKPNRSKIPVDQTRTAISGIITPRLLLCKSLKKLDRNPMNPQFSSLSRVPFVVVRSRIDPPGSHDRLNLPPLVDVEYHLRRQIKGQVDRVPLSWSTRNPG